MAPALKPLLTPGRCPLAPGVYDCLSARLAEQAGFEVVSISGYGVEASHLGLPDLGFLGLEDMAGVADRISDAVRIPVICDIDTGYGGPRSVYRAVRRLEKSGAAAVHVEDQMSPKKCGAMAGRDVVPGAEMVAKIKAAVDARAGDMMIIARTDARESSGLAAVIERLNLYLEAGADMGMLAESYSAAELESIGKAVAGPVALCVGVPGWQATHGTMADYARMGFRLAIAPFLCIGPAARAMQQALAATRAADAVGPALTDDAFLHHDRLNAAVGLDQWQRREAGYEAPDGRTLSRHAAAKGAAAPGLARRRKT